MKSLLSVLLLAAMAGAHTPPKWWCRKVQP